MKYEWDKRKNTANIRKHGVSFARAVRIFDGPVAEEIDDAEDYGEERVMATGLIDDVEFVVVYTDRVGGERRIISARKATPQERRAYWKAVTGLD